MHEIDVKRRRFGNRGIGVLLELENELRGTSSGYSSAKRSSQKEANCKQTWETVLKRLRPNCPVAVVAGL